MHILTVCKQMGTLLQAQMPASVWSMQHVLANCIQGCRPPLAAILWSELDTSAGTCGRSCLIENSGSKLVSAYEPRGLAPRDTKSSSVSSDSPKLSVAMAISADAAERILSCVKACRHSRAVVHGHAEALLVESLGSEGQRED